ncbi:hypothetical protein DL546_009761 [Coniochaeta pulveracea]|uniref:Uncharacterized protein n=1 Tax=Coniochaeta pulveracea TaxID=177199 RepID=A0A420YN44_9PEZI|nr:hypothetical protein DL546_009761 [Coniochaeta pulveracea]
MDHCSSSRASTRPLSRGSAATIAGPGRSLEKEFSPRLTFPFTALELDVIMCNKTDQVQDPSCIVPTKIARLSSEEARGMDKDTGAFLGSLNRASLICCYCQAVLNDPFQIYSSSQSGPLAADLCVMNPAAGPFF